ncbi:hypothetical protein, partial [Alistipes sp.]|uniref:hypothetical protein n=1 Tax=Alistipes sp. TaxID=1872444 RepID=UPI003AB706DD
KYPVNLIMQQDYGVLFRNIAVKRKLLSILTGGVLAAPLSASASGACRSMWVGRKVISMMWGLGSGRDKKRGRGVSLLPQVIGNPKPESCPAPLLVLP